MRPFWLWHCSSYLKSESATKTWVKCAFQKGDERWYTGDESDVQGPVVWQVLPCRTHGSFWSYTFKFKRITLKYVFLLLIKYVYHHQIVMDWIGSRKHDMPLKMATFYGDFVFFGGLCVKWKKWFGLLKGTLNWYRHAQSTFKIIFHYFFSFLWKTQDKMKQDVLQ